MFTSCMQSINESLLTHQWNVSFYAAEVAHHSFNFTDYYHCIKRQVPFNIYFTIFEGYLLY